MRLLFATLLCGTVLPGLSLPADACSRKGGPPTQEETILEADEIFVARLNSVSEIRLVVDPDIELDEDDLEDLQALEGRYTLIETLKGRPSRQGIVNDLPFGPGNCSLGLMVGWDYVFFIKHDPEEPDYRWVGMFSGSFPLGPHRRPEEQETELLELKQKINQLTTTDSTP